MPKIYKREQGVDSTTKAEGKLSPSTLDREKRTVESVLTTERRVLRTPWFDEPYYEILSIDPKHIRTERLEKGIPVLDGHDWSGSVAKQLGRADGLTIVDGELRTTLRFSKKELAETVFQDIEDGIVDKTSIGYVVYKYEDITTDDDKIKTLKAIDWEPYEISCVPIPADIDAQLRSKNNDIQGEFEVGKKKTATKKVRTQKEIDEEKAKAKKAGEETEEKEEDAEEERAEGDEEETDADAEESEVEAEAETEELTEEEKKDEKRSLKILSQVRKAGLTQEFAEKLIRSNQSAEKISDEIINELGKKQGAHVKTQRAEVLNDPKDMVQKGMREAVLFRAGSKTVKELSENGRRFANMKLIDMARSYHNMDYSHSADEIVKRAFHSTSDFSNILIDAVNVSLAFEYAEAPQTFENLVRRVPLTDFRTKHIVDYGAFPALKKIGETGELQAGTMSDGKESYKLDSYGSKIMINRQTIINDTLDVFSQLPKLAAQSARNLESDLVYALITSNPVMGDGNKLFSAAHKNIVAGPAFDLANVAAAWALMKKQMGKDNKHINLTPEFILSPVALEFAVLQFLSDKMVATKQSDVNPLASRFKGNISDSRLDDSSATKYYLTASSSSAGIIELGTLDGAGPSTNTEEKFGSGVSFEILHDVGVGLVDYKGLVGVGAFA